ncbi:MAG: hypothetical protein JSW27_00125, partial [Phycisphaerales bacterium]
GPETRVRRKTKPISGAGVPVPGASTATLVTLQPDSTTGEKAELLFDNHQMTIDVTERPVFIAVR